MIVVKGGSRVAVPKGSMNTGEFSPSPSTPPPSPLPQPPGPFLSLEAHISAPRPKFQSWGPNPLRLGFGPWRWDFGFKMGFGPWGWDLGLQTRIWALRMVYGGREKEGGGEGKEADSPLWKHGHRLLLGRCPKSREIIDVSIRRFSVHPTISLIKSLSVASNEDLQVLVFHSWCQMTLIHGIGTKSLKERGMNIGNKLRRVLTALDTQIRLRAYSQAM